MEDLNKYKIFYEVAKEGNITKASEKLFISQPAVSQTIKKLEDDLDTTLFLRSKKGVTLTKIGKEIFAKVEAVILSLKSIDKLVEDEQELNKGKIVIGAGSNIARDILAKPITEFLKEFPNVNIEQFEEPQEIMFDLLREGKADILISQQNEDVEGLGFCPLKSYSYVFVKSQKGRDDRFIVISKGSYTYKLFNETIKNIGKKDFQLITVSGYIMALELAKMGLGITMVPSFIAKRYMEDGELIEVLTEVKLPKINFGYYYNNYLLTPATKVFIKFLQE